MIFSMAVRRCGFSVRRIAPRRPQVAKGQGGGLVVQG